MEGAKEKVLTRFIEKLKESKIDFSHFDAEDFKYKAEGVFKSVLREKRISLSPQEHENILDELVSYFLGLGPIDKFLKDPEITEVMVNGPKEVYIERNGNLEKTEVTFIDEERLNFIIDKIISPLGRRVNELEPYVDARLSDGSRVNIVKSPVSSVGPILTIRKYSRRILNTDDLISNATLNNTAAEFLKACAVAKVNIIISGGGGSGKTTLLNILASFIPKTERIIVIEDTLELRLPDKHILSLETRSPNIEGKGEITIRDLVKNSLHMRPDRIIVGEVRSNEVLDMIQAMNTGHEGSMTTLHANSPLDTLERLEVLVLMGSANISSEVAKKQIISAIDLVVHMARFPDGSRKISHISEVIKSQDYKLEDIFVLEETPNHERALRFTGRTPEFYHKLNQRANYFYP